MATVSSQSVLRAPLAPVANSSSNRVTVSSSVSIRSSRFAYPSFMRRGENRPWTHGRVPILNMRCCALSSDLRATLDKVVTSNKVVLFMKGTKDFPQCGFSNTVVQILISLNVPFESFNILENDVLRQGLKVYSSWPTFPQLYIDGEFYGGCDITVEAFKSGELQELLERVNCS